MQRIVLDTNVLVSGLHFGGIPALVMTLVADGICLSVTSPALLAEFHRVLLTKFRYPPSIADQVISEWKTMSEEVHPADTLTVITSDPTDNRVLECALSGRVDAIISGDRHVLELKTFRTIPILTPQAFLAKWRAKLH